MLQRWLLRRGKDFSGLPDCQGLDEKKSSLIVARAKQQNFLRVEAERFGAQGRFDLFQSSFLSLWGTFALKITFTIIGILIKCLIPELHAGAVLLSFLGARVVFSSVHIFRLICRWLFSSLMSPKLWSSLFSVPLLCDQYNLF